jgi:endonuclease/exonuclease/phosphatase (EEP) superfamily protein YafD
MAAVAATCAVLTVAYRVSGDTSTLGEMVTVWPPVLWTLVLLPRVLWTWLHGGRREAALGALAIVAFLLLTTELTPLVRALRATDVRRGGPTTPGPAGPVARADQPEDLLSFRVVTWNVAGGAPFDELASLQPDIVFVQECGAGPALAGRWDGYTWVSTLDPATLCRFPVRALPTESIGPWMAPQLLLADLPADRRVLLVNVRLVLPAIVIAAASGDLPSLAEAHAERVAQFTRLAALVERTARRENATSVILAGDFNTPGGARSLRALAPLRDVWPEAGRGWGGTMTAEMPLARIDQVWVSRNVAVRSARVAGRGRSDHRALVVDLEVR